MLMRKTLIGFAFALVAAASLSADVVETKNGSRIVGKIAKIDAGNVYISTDYAGDIVVKQKEVTSITTDAPLAVRLDNGTRMEGTVATHEGAVQVVGTDGTITTSVPKIAEIWAVGAKDPALVALERHWKYEAAVDIVGTSGNHEQLGTGATVEATLVAPEDTLGFNATYNRQVTDHVVSADQFKAGVDYTSKITDRSSWFVRDEAGFDRVMDIRFFETAAAGAGYDFFKNAFDLTTGRVGLAYQYTGYSVPFAPAVNSAAADFEFANDYKTKTWELVNKLTYVPTFSNTANYNLTQDSYYQIPLLNPAWKLRVEVSNYYDSLPPRGVKRLDTTYSTRLILDWQ